jgi:ubiquinone/menaquinone biosynthesis C-methylase UbiE
MADATRLASEQLFHDRQAWQRSETFARDPDKLCFANDAYLDHESWIRPAIRKLGDVAGLDVLDYGCGHGMAAVVFARLGARVTGFDISAGYLAEARARAAANGVCVRYVHANAEQLPFACKSFDRVWGNAVLHHLDVRRAGHELHRILKPGGIAVFCEPWGSNTLLQWARCRLNYQAKDRTKDEQPLREKDLRTLRAIFPDLQIQAFQLLSMIRRVWKNQWAVSVLEEVDNFLLDRLPSLHKYCRYAVLTLIR